MLQGAEADAAASSEEARCTCDRTGQDCVRPRGGQAAPTPAAARTLFGPPQQPFDDASDQASSLAKLAAAAQARAHASSRQSDSWQAQQQRREPEGAGAGRTASRGSGRKPLAPSPFALLAAKSVARSSWPLGGAGGSDAASPGDQGCRDAGGFLSPSSSRNSSQSCSVLLTPCYSPTSQASSSERFSSGLYRLAPCDSGVSVRSTLGSSSGSSEAGSSGRWSVATHAVQSRPAPGGPLGAGIGWVLPEFGGREVLAAFEFGQTLGCGTFGVTRLVTHRKTARPWACKTICKASIAASPAAQSDVQQEVAILQHLAGQRGVVQLHGVYEDERNIHLVMELCTGGDLLDYISRFGRLCEDEAADVAAAMLSTLAHCHALGVVHRDIKPENFLLGAPAMLGCPPGSAAAVLRMSDFGVSAFHTPGQAFCEIVGTPFYMAPEVLERCYGPAADVWSAGVVVYLMLAGCLPFNGASDRQIIKAVLDSQPDFAGPAWAGISARARAFVASMLVKDPSRRASLAQLLAHPWLAGRAALRRDAPGAAQAARASGSSASGSRASCDTRERALAAQGRGVSWADDTADSAGGVPGRLAPPQPLSPIRAARTPAAGAY